MARVFLACGHYTHDVAFDGGALECPWGCGTQKRDDEPLQQFTSDITGDPVTEHYNHSLGEVVRSRTHLRRIQKTHGTEDFRPSPEMKDRIDRARRRLELKHGL